jgi:hypothetical protein
MRADGRISAWGLKVVLLAAACGSGRGWGQGAAGGQGAPLARDPVVTGAAVASETYLGMVACARCAGTRVELALYRSGDAPGQGAPAAYHMRETFYGATAGDASVDEVRDTNGVWRESRAPDGHGWVVQLASGRTGELEYFERVERNEGELVLLDQQLHELPGDVPHRLGRVTGDHQLHMVFLTEADDGRTLELKPGEVFEVRLETKKPAGYLWTSDRPPAMALLETGGEPVAAPSGAGTGTGTAQQPAGPVSGPAAGPASGQGAGVGAGTATGSLAQGAAGGGTVRVSTAKIPAKGAAVGTQYQVWQLIAPPPGVLPLRFELKSASDMAAPAVKAYTLTIVTR